MRYICCKNYKKNNGNLFIRRGEVVREEYGSIFYDAYFVCLNTSQNAYDFFAKDCDGRGFDRFRLSHKIINSINQEQFEKLPEHFKKNGWFSFYFYNASVEELENIIKEFEL